MHDYCCNDQKRLGPRLFELCVTALDLARRAAKKQLAVILGKPYLLSFQALTVPQRFGAEHLLIADALRVYFLSRP